MHLVVVGGAGFIGRHFVDAALRREHRITVVGRAAAPPPDLHVDYRSGGLQGLAADPDLLARADLVCHFATAATPATSNRDPAADIDDNLRQTVLLLEAMRATGNRRILFLSSGGAVYGTPQYLPIDERHPLNPISSYGVVKVAIENYLRMYETSYDFRAMIVRLANPYGPIQSSTPVVGAVTRFLEAALKGDPITIWGNGSVVRDYVYVADVVALLLDAAEREAVGTFNCGTGTGVSLLELVNLIELVTARTLAIGFEAARSFDPPSVILDVSHAASALSWRPEVNLKAGIKLIAERHATLL